MVRVAELDSAVVVLHSMELPPDRFGNAVCLLDTSKGLR
jgi:hypothetical protein